jgi:hypothetical protein
MHGLQQCRAASLELAREFHPVSHIVTNIVIGQVSPTGVEVLSKGLGPMTSGAMGTVVYHDQVVRTPGGWRLGRRRVIARRQPLTPYDLPAEHQPA